MKKYIETMYTISIVLLLITPSNSVAMFRGARKLLPTARTAGRRLTRKYHDYIDPAFGKKQPKIPQQRKQFTGMGKAESPSLPPGYKYNVQYSRSIPVRSPIPLKQPPAQYPTFTPKRAYTPIFKESMWNTGKNLRQKAAAPTKRFWQETMMPGMRRTAEQIPRPKNIFTKKPPYRDYIKEARKKLEKPTLKTYQLPPQTFGKSIQQFITKAPQYARNWWRKSVIPRAQQFGQYFKYFPLTSEEAKVARAQYRQMIRTMGIPKKQEAVLLPYLEKMIAKRIPLATQQKIAAGLATAFFGAALITGHQKIADSFMETVDNYLGSAQPEEEFDPENKYQELYESQPQQIYHEAELPQFPQTGKEYQPERIYTEADFEQ